MSETIEYLIQFLLGENISSETIASIGYTNDIEEFKRYKIVIKPSNFFDNEVYGTELSIPKLPLKIWEETPVLFGEPSMDEIGDTLVINADIVASSYFLISRYEEFVRYEVRDQHGRFPGKESIPYRAGFIDRPLVDEYGKILRELLRQKSCDVPEPPKEISKIFLTHDVDQLAHFRNLRGMLGGFLRGIKRPKEGQMALKSFFSGLRFDPWYTFPFLFKIDNELIIKLGNKRCEAITFIRSGGGKRKEDKPVTNLIHPDYKTLLRYSKRKNVKIGLHASYESGIHPSLIIDEKNKLSRIAKVKINYSRHHFLNSREPIDMLALIDAGITDDFTMGYADMAGFRLGTCRPVKWINLKTREVTSLILHSLAIMDVTLSEKRYMYMNAHDAYNYCIQLIDCVEKNNGEISLLWHNNSVEKTPKSYHRKLYSDLLKYLFDK